MARDIPAGGACVLGLPHGPKAASLARALLVETMGALRFAARVIDDAEVCVSELATNAHLHARRAVVPPEMWIWARSRPRPELVVSVFDSSYSWLPAEVGAGLLDEHGKGLGIVTALAAGTGAHFTRSRMAGVPVCGKAVWFTVPLPESWPRWFITPARAAQWLLLALHARGVHAVCRGDDVGVSVISTGELNVWVGRRAYSWQEGGGYERQPLIDLQETAERIVRHLLTGSCREGVR